MSRGAKPACACILEGKALFCYINHQIDGSAGGGKTMQNFSFEEAMSPVPALWAAWFSCKTQNKDDEEKSHCKFLHYLDTFMIDIQRPKNNQRDRNLYM